MPKQRAAVEEADSKGDQPLDRALAVLEFVLDQRGPVAASAIGEATGLPPATVHRLILQLEARSLLKRALGSKKLLPGGRLVALGTRILSAAFVADETHALLVALAAKLREHCHIGTISGGEVCYVDSARSARRSGLLFEPGGRAPIYCTSIGKVYLAGLSESDFQQVTAALDFKAFTPKTITSLRKLAADIALVRARGWASTDEEFTPGVVGCAVPLRNSKGEFLAGLGVSVPAALCPYEEIGKFVPDLLETASQIEAALAV
ncbi:IclR family transcriptional regulator domain-containing protein [Enterovirga aerilata]|uniref:IclR family transcriptional regulator n=1 Tax=Enterovirga aerilata TaxID=2730920 RepID=A0A849HUT8_9HYPH|nr:IclR family transcriptional regulator [Enterovirga sp. DB1703]